jgi:hypothetical protein
MLAVMKFTGAIMKQIENHFDLTDHETHNAARFRDPHLALINERNAIVKRMGQTLHRLAINPDYIAYERAVKELRAFDDSLSEDAREHLRGLQAEVRNV